MRKNKKAMSDVVSTVLIILLVVAAIAIIGTIVLNVVQKGGTAISGLSTCQSIQLNPTSCTDSAVGVNNDAKAQLVSAGSFEDGYTLKNVSFMFEQSGGAVSVRGAKAMDVAALTIGGTVSVNPFSDNPDVDYKSVKVAAVLTLGDGTEYTCEPSTVSTNC